MLRSRLITIALAYLCMPIQASNAQGTEYECEGVWAVDMKFEGKWAKGWAVNDPPLEPHEFEFEIDFAAEEFCRGGSCKEFVRFEGRKIIVAEFCRSEDACWLEDFDLDSGAYRRIRLMADEHRGMREITYANCEG